MKSEWREQRWGDVATLEYGRALRGHGQNSGRFRVFGTNGPIGWHDEALCQHPGVIIGRKGAYRGVHYSPAPFFVIDTAFYLSPKTQIDLRWAYYELLAQDINSLDSGSAIPSTSRESFYSLPVRIPPLPEQRAIAHILGTLDDKIELNRRMSETLEEMARAIFKSWFVDFDPVRAKAAVRREHPDWTNAQVSRAACPNLKPEIAELFPDRLVDSELGEIPEGWEVGTLPEIVDFLEGPGLRNWQYREQGMNFLNIRCISDGDIDIAKANCISIEEFEKKYRHFALQEDDIVISTSGTLGRLAIVRSDHLPVMLNTSIIRMRGRGSVGLAYLWGFFQSEYFISEMFAFAAGSVQLNFGPVHLRQILTIRPPDGILCGFECASEPLLRKSIHLRKASRTLAAIRDALLPKLISGELRVKDAEGFLKEREL